MSAVRLCAFTDLAKVFVIDETPNSKSANEKMAHSLGFEDCPVEKWRMEGETYFSAKERLRNLWKAGKHPDQNISAVALT